MLPSSPHGRELNSRNFTEPGWAGRSSDRRSPLLAARCLPTMTRAQNRLCTLTPRSGGMQAKGLRQELVGAEAGFEVVRDGHDHELGGPVRPREGDQPLA